jgi:streptogramin lyase/mono/diheme cytochrome c family protein
MKKHCVIWAAAALLASAGSAWAAGEVSGTIKGPDGAAMRAVWVRAEEVGTKRTTSVLSNNEGRFRIPDLPPGKYQVWATAIGWRGTPARLSDVNVAEGQKVAAEFAMRAVPVQWHELTKAQAMTLMPEGPGREVFFTNCMNCHGMGKFIGRRDEEGWLNAIDTMRRVGVTTIRPDIASQVAGYLAAVLGPDSSTPQSPASLPAWKDLQMQWTDESLKIVYVDYPVKSGPAGRPGVGEMDKNGMVWMETDNGIIKLDPESGDTKAYYVPESMGDQGSMHEVTRDRTDEAIWWLTASGKNSLVKFDSRTEKFEVFKDPTMGPRVKQLDPNTPDKFPRVADAEGALGRKHTAVVDFDGNVWMTGRPLTKFNPKTKEWTAFLEVPDVYGIDVDHAGNVWFAEFNGAATGSVGKVDPKTGKVTKFKPPSVSGRPRRLHIDSKDNVWFGQYFNGTIGKLEPRTQEIVEYKLPGPYPTVYGFGLDKQDNAWGVSHFNEATFRVDPTGKVTAYPSPYFTRGSRDLKVDAKGRMWGGIQPDYRIGYFYIAEP